MIRVQDVPQSLLNSLSCYLTNCSRTWGTKMNNISFLNIASNIKSSPFLGFSLQVVVIHTARAFIGLKDIMVARTSIQCFRQILMFFLWGLPTCKCYGSSSVLKNSQNCLLFWYIDTTKVFTLCTTYCP